MLELTRNSLVRAALTGSVVLSVVAPHQAGAQAAPAGFTVDDVLDVRNANVADVSRDGRWC